MAGGQAEELREALPHRAHELLHRRLAVGGAEQAGPGARHGLDLCRADLGGAGAEAAVGGQQVLGDGDVCGQRALPRG